MRKKLLFIFNPRSGKGQTKNKLCDIIDIFVKGGYEVIVYPTQGSRDAAKMACEMAEEVDMIACAGGDGTLDEVVTGIMKSGIRVPLGYIPAGSTNDFASSLGISKDMVKAAKDIVKGRIFPFDVGEFNKGTFVYIAAFAMGNHDAAVVGWHDAGTMIRHARDTDEMHLKELGVDDLAWLKTLPYVYEDENLAVAHANFACPQGMGYIHDRFDARRSFICQDEERILFVGHTHLEALYGFGFASDPHFPDCRTAQPHDFELADGWRYLINVGSVGYPRVKPYSSYVLYDPETGRVCFRKVEFDFSGYVSALRAKSIPVPDWLEDR